MKTIKFRYTFKHTASGNIEVKFYYLSQLEERAANELSPCFTNDYKLLRRDQYTGLKDKKGNEIYDGDSLKITKTLNKNLKKGSIARVSWSINECSYFLLGEDGWYMGDLTENKISGMEVIDNT